MKRPKAKLQKKKTLLNQMSVEEQQEALKNMLGGRKRKGHQQLKNSPAMSATIIQRWFKRRLAE